ncbi:hypothetical protein CDD83_902 [Cordyceps sp. RAO-2017]|nr:hypothetical protein CDD83_902 [Cordyceps sp. RAO-2017]
MSNDEYDRLFREICWSRDPDAAAALIQELVQGGKPRRAILLELALMNGKEGRQPQQGAAGQPPEAAGSAPSPELLVCPHCLSQVPSAALYRSPSSPSDLGGLPVDSANDAESTPAMATPVSLLSLPFDDSNQLQVDRWTRTGWTMSSVQQLIETLLTWDYLPCCLMCKEPFLWDYQAGLNRFCSPALVNALLALATCVVHENGEKVESPAAWSSSKAFYDEAEALLHGAGPSSNNLPDIQALGILSLYKLSCGYEAESLELAETFAARISYLCMQGPLLGVEGEEYARVRATAYCGAISLVRILRLLTIEVFGPSTSHISPDDSIFLDQPACKTQGKPGDQYGNAPVPSIAIDARNPQINDLQLIPARIFQLTEWVYKLLSAVNSSKRQLDLGRVRAVYTKCLGWYDQFFSLLTADGCETPFMLFIHMYYQFCLLCLFRPFAHLESDVRSREIYLQAAHSILTLAQSYCKLFTLRRVSGFVPYFVYASGLAGPSYGPGHHGTGFPYAGTRLVGNVKQTLPATSEFDDDKAGTFKGAACPPTPVEETIIAHASQLLTEMSLKHRMTPFVGRVLNNHPN